MKMPLLTRSWQFFRKVTYLGASERYGGQFPQDSLAYVTDVVFTSTVSIRLLSHNGWYFSSTHDNFSFVGIKE